MKNLAPSCLSLPAHFWTDSLLVTEGSPAKSVDDNVAGPSFWLILGRPSGNGKIVVTPPLTYLEPLFKALLCTINLYSGSRHFFPFPLQRSFGHFQKLDAPTLSWHTDVVAFFLFHGLFFQIEVNEVKDPYCARHYWQIWVMMRFCSAPHALWSLKRVDGRGRRTGSSMAGNMAMDDGVRRNDSVSEYRLRRMSLDGYGEAPHILTRGSDHSGTFNGDGWTW